MSAKRCSQYLIPLLSLLASPGVIAGAPAVIEKLTAGTGTGGIQHVSILGGSYYFKPNYIIVKVNIPVELSVKRERGVIPHTFVLKIPESGLMIDETLDSNDKTIAFTPTSVGKFPFYCRNKFLLFKSHEEKDMKGILEVIP